MRTMRHLTSSLAHALGVFLALLLATLVLIATGETLAWTFFEVSWAAASEIEGILLIWFGLLSAAWGIHLRIHLGVEVLTRRLPDRAKAVLGRIASALVALFGGLLAVYGAKLAATVSNTLPATGLPASVQYFPAAVCGILMAIFGLEEMILGPPRRQDSDPDETYPRDTGPRDTYPRDTYPRDTVPRDTYPRDTDAG